MKNKEIKAFEKKQYRNSLKEIYRFRDFWFVLPPLIENA